MTGGPAQTYKSFTNENYHLPVR